MEFNLDDPCCSLRPDPIEDICHLFFCCNYSKEVLAGVFHWMGMFFPFESEKSLNFVKNLKGPLQRREWLELSLLLLCIVFGRRGITDVSEEEPFPVELLFQALLLL